jgi:hypothetical protein
MAGACFSIVLASQKLTHLDIICAKQIDFQKKLIIKPI